MEIAELCQKVIAFRDERNWAQFHNSKDLALSLNLEASEVLECFQWLSSEQAEEKNHVRLIDELADVLICTLQLSHTLQIDLEKAVLEKLKKNALKYPIEKSFGKSLKYNELL